jgi:hypothetical protein
MPRDNHEACPATTHHIQCGCQPTVQGGTRSSDELWAVSDIQCGWEPRARSHIRRPEFAVAVRFVDFGS